jgi:FkbM family methyltransferase
VYVPAPEKPLAHRSARFIAWKAGEVLVDALSAATGFRVPDEPLQPFLINLPMLVGRYEPATLAAMREIVKPGMTVVDGGAHIGYFTVALSKMVGPHGRVLAFEMNPATLRRLRHNVRHLRNVEIISAALGVSDDRGTMYQSPGLTSSASVTETKPGLHAAQSVQIRSLASVLDERRIERIDFLKLDIEGNEPIVLRILSGPVAAIFEVKRYILEAGGETPERLLVELMDAGFSVRIIGGGYLAPPDLTQPLARLDKANILAIRD